MDILEYCNLLPKAELHIHLQGTVKDSTLRKIASSHGIIIPPLTSEGAPAFQNLEEFLAALSLITASVQTADDFHQVTYEMLANCASNGARYVEFFFSPQAHMKFGASYAVMLEGIRQAMRDAEKDHKIVSRAIPAHNRELGSAEGVEFIELIQSCRIDEVIGVGLDYNEVPHPPKDFVRMYEQARNAGLKTTAHAGETGPADYVRSALDDLKCMRIDHGYAIVDDTALMQRCRDEEVLFTVCPSTTLFTTKWRDISSPEHAIRRMKEACLTLAVNTDDPPLFGTNLSNEYILLAEKGGFTVDDLASCAMNSLKHSWMDAWTKRQWVNDWSKEIDRLVAAFKSHQVTRLGDGRR